MTNEELVKLIQDGQTEYIPQLWDQVYKYIRLLAKRRLIGEESHIKELEDDLVNEAYFDFLIALDGYKPDGGARFLTYLTYGLKNSFNRALGLRTHKDKQNIMHSVVSLDAPLENAEDITLHDLVADQLSEDDHRFVEDQYFWQDVHELLEEAINERTTGRIQEAFLIMLHENCTFLEACRRMGIPEEKQRSMYSMHTTGLRHIKLQLKGRAWKRCQQVGIDEYLSTGLRGSGLAAYRRNGFTSSTELSAIRMADKELWHKKIVEIFG